LDLIIDIGNTKTKIAVFNINKLIYRKEVISNSEKELASILSKYSGICSAIISSVKNDDKFFDKYLSLKKVHYIRLSHTTPLPFKNLYQSRQTLGQDRIAIAAAACSLFPVENVMAIDTGTSITYDFVNNRNEYLGGGISPGLQMRFWALHTFTDKLPLINFETDKLPLLVGRNTEEAILSGVLNGMVAEIDGLIDAYRITFGELKVILGGGDYKYFDKRLKNSIFARPNLVLEGLKKILDFNDEN